MLERQTHKKKKNVFKKTVTLIALMTSKIINLKTTITIKIKTQQMFLKKKFFDTFKIFEIFLDFLFFHFFE